MGKVARVHRGARGMTVFSATDVSRWLLCVVLLVSCSHSVSEKASEAGEEGEAVLGVAILSKSTNAEQRQVLRDTWFQLPSVVNGSVYKRFFIARPEGAALSALEAEAAKYGDITIIEQMEGYDNLPYQTMAGLKHFTQQQKARFIVKADDDVFVRTEVMHRYFKGLMEEYGPKSRVYMGWMVEGAKPHRNGKWAMTKAEFPGEEYPVYASGPSYCLSRGLAAKVVKKAAKMKWIKLEDVGTGLWVSKVGKGASVWEWNERRFHKGRVCAGWAWTHLLEKGRPLLFQQQDVRTAMHHLRQEEERGAGPEEVACGAGTSLAEVKGRVACDKQRRGEDGAKECAPWLAAHAPALGPAPPPRDPKLFFNLYPGGGEQIQKAAEGAVVSEAEKAEADWHASWAQGTRPKLTGKVEEEEEKKEKKKKKKEKREVVVHVHDDLQAYHPLLQARGSLACTVPCTFVHKFGESGASVGADASVFLGDLEVYRKDPGSRPIPTPKGVLRAVAFREAESKFPSHAWAKYDVNITYSRAAHVPFGYVDSVDELLAAAREAGKAGRGEREVLLSAVALRCGNPAHEGKDRRAARTKLIRELSAEVEVRSYGACANNAPWPPGHSKDKAFVSRNSRFCLAFENSVDADYVTEKLFDCLAAASIPVVSAGPHVRAFAPPKGAIFVEDFEDAAALASKIRQVDGDAEAYAEMRRWITEPEMAGWREWAEVLRGVEGVGGPCRLCAHVARLKGLAFPSFIPAPEAERRAGEREAVREAQERERAERKRLADPAKVRVEL